MFELEKVKSLNELEMAVYEYVISHLKEVQKMTIRELSDVCHVSTSTILRCCNKLGFQGYSELKYAIKKELSRRSPSFESFFDTTVQVDQFLKKVNQENYHKVLEPAVELICESNQVIFFGIGTSGILGEYGSRYFMNVGMVAFSITDPFTPLPANGLEKTLAIILSVSGETEEMITQAQNFKQIGAKILSITNQEYSTLAKLSNYNLSYHMPEITSMPDPSLNLTTQTPVVTLIEILAHQSNKKTKNIKNSSV